MQEDARDEFACSAKLVETTTKVLLKEEEYSYNLQKYLKMHRLLESKEHDLQEHTIPGDKRTDSSALLIASSRP